jgi:DNA invertase Pin-like site-specific DNA recombinase
VQSLVGQGSGTSTIAKNTGLTRQTVLRIKTDPVEAEANLATWGL